MKKFFVPILFLLIINSPLNIFSQTTFTKITTGPIVTDGGASWGCSWGDYDGDGKQDLIVINRGSVDGHLFMYHNDGGGVFTRVLTGPIATDSALYTTATWGDYDNDGKLDLFLSTFNNENNLLYHNEGSGVFTKVITGVIVSDGGASNNSSWVDFNNDGKLDMCVTNYGQKRFLYQGDGIGGFVKITTGAFVNDVSGSISSAWGDYNNDGLMDVYIANNGAALNNNFFYKNDGAGNFTKMTALNIVSDTTKSFSVSWGDFNNDGFEDLFVAGDGVRNDALYRNNKDGSFTNEISSVVALDQYSVMGNWADYDNDGFLDLFVSRWQNQNNLLYHNNGNGTFTKITLGDIANDHGNSFGCAWADYDNDGDMDLVVGNINNENNFLYRNNATAENTNKWITIKCVGTTSNKSAIGAKVLVKANINGTSQWQLREITAGTGYASQNDMRAHFGLGTAAVIDSIKIMWPSGSVNSFTNIGVNRFATITENGSLVGVNGTEVKIPNGFELQQNYPNPFNPSTVIKFTVPYATIITLKVYNTSGKEITTLLNKSFQQGSHEVEFNSEGLASGVYYYTLAGDNFSDTKKMILIK